MKRSSLKIFGYNPLPIAINNMAIFKLKDKIC
jgi:hypothetical protein